MMPARDTTSRKRIATEIKVAALVILLGGSCLLHSIFLDGLFLLALPTDVLFNLVGGWIFFLVRTVPGISIDARALLPAAGGLAALGVGMQFLLMRFNRQVPEAARRESNWPRRWRLRWTAALFSLFGLLLVSGLSTFGLAGQVLWLATTREPLTEGGSEDFRANVRATNRLKAMGQAIEAFHDGHGHFPPGGTFDDHGSGLHGWQTELLPYLGHKELQEHIDRSKPWDHPDNAPHFRTVLTEFQYGNPPHLPSRNRGGLALSHYAANVHVLGGGTPLTFSRITNGNGTAMTLLAGQAAGNPKPWGHPMNWRDPTRGLNQSPDGFGNPTKKPTLFLWADGSVRALKDGIDPQVLRALSVPDDYLDRLERERGGSVRSALPD